MLKRLTPNQQPKMLAVFGTILCFVFAASSLEFKDISKIVEPIIVLLGFWGIYRYGKGLPVKTPMLLFLASILIPLLSWSLAYQAEPEWVKDTPQLEKFARLFVFIPLAWFLKDSPRKVFVFWTIAAGGILAMPWLSGGGWTELKAGLDGKRVGWEWGVKNSQHTSLLFGFVTIGLVIFAKRIFEQHIVFKVLWLLSLLLAIYVLAAAQTRAAWGALFASLILITCILAYRTFTGKVHISRKVITLSTLGLFVLVVAIQQTIGPVLEKRLERSGDSQVAMKLLQGNFNDIPYNSWGIRANTWKAAAEHIAERPLTGWGGKGQSIAINRTEWLPDRIQKQFGHMHNIYIALLLQYGIIGFVFYFIWTGWMLVSVLKVISQKHLKHDVGYFAVAALTFWSVVGLAESYLFFWTGVFCIQAIFGGLLALIWHAKLHPPKTH